MDLLKLYEIQKKLPKFRVKQINHFLFNRLEDNWKLAFDIPSDLRNQLNELVNLKINSTIYYSKDKSIKAVILLRDKQQIETVLIPINKNNFTLCVSSQTGCNLKCKFCKTGESLTCRNLTTGEILDQYLLFARILKKLNKRISNIVFMGMGEPLLNIDHVLTAINIFNSKEINIGARKISISTAGIPDKIIKIANFSKEINLAISLHFPFDNLRSKFMPINKKFNIKSVINAADQYIEKTHRKVLIEYIVFENINDNKECINQLIKLFKTKLYTINLLRYNETDKNFKSPNLDKIIKIKNRLKNHGIETTIRKSFGADINAACGQLSGNINKKRDS